MAGGQNKGLGIERLCEKAAGTSWLAQVALIRVGKSRVRRDLSVRNSTVARDSRISPSSTKWAAYPWWITWILDETYDGTNTYFEESRSCTLAGTTLHVRSMSFFGYSTISVHW